MELSDLKKLLDEDLDKQLINSFVLLSKFRMLTEDSRKSPSYIDPNNFPFYYHLGKHIKPISFLEIGFDLGLRSACFFKSCSTVQKFYAYNTNEDTKRLGSKNIRDVYKGNFELKISGIIELLQWIRKATYDFTIINIDLHYDEFRNVFDVVYDQMNLGGFVVIGDVESNLICKDAFKAFYQIKNREPIFFKTRYGCAMLQR